MKLRIEKGIAKGEITAPPSKSMEHRLLICAGLSEGKSIIKGISDCDDVLATLDCLNALGINNEINGNDITVYGKNIRALKPQGVLECRESGSTLRFILPVAMLLSNETIFHGAESLMSRPMTVFEELFPENYRKDGQHIYVKGGLKGGEYTVKGNISSQFISGLLFALPLTDTDSTIKIIPPIESRSYINLTLNALKQFGVNAYWSDENTLFVAGNQAYKSSCVTVEGDYSGAAFIDAFNLFGADVTVAGLNSESVQGDRIYKEYFKLLNCDNAVIDIEDCPDLAPILFSVAAAKKGGVFKGTKRLKIKESDRASTMAQELRKFGTKVEISENSVTVTKADFHAPTEPLYGHNDHRVVMSLAVLLTLTGGEIDGAEAVAKSYPHFFEDLSALGIKVEEIIC